MPSPISTALVSAKHGIIDSLHLHDLIGLLLNIIVHIQNETRFLAFRKRITVHGGTLSGRQLGFHTVSIQENRIISRFGILVPVRKSRSERTLLTLFPKIFHLLLTYGRHQKKITEIGTARTAKACVGKTIDGGIFVIVARTGVPAIDTRIRTRLNHSVRQHGTRMRMSVSSRSDKRIDITGVFFHFRCLGRTCTQT